MTRLLDGGVGQGRPLDYSRYPTSLTLARQLPRFVKFFKIFASLIFGGELGNARVEVQVG